MVQVQLLEGPRFIATERDGSTKPGDPYLSRVPDIYSHIYICPIVCPHLLGGYFNACNSIVNQNSMRQYDIFLEKYWVTKSGYFRLATTGALGMGITYGKILYCNGITEGNVDREIFNIGVQQ